MSQVDFSYFDASWAWFEEQTPQVRSLITSRAVLRVLANVRLFDGDRAQTLPLVSFRAVLLSAVLGSGRTADIEKAANSATESAFSAARFVNNAAGSAASSAGNSVSSAHSAEHAARSVHSASASAENSAFFFSNYVASAASAARSAVYSALSADAEKVIKKRELKEVWRAKDILPSIQSQHEKFVKILGGEVDWSFWHNWYLAMWNGTFKDWDFAHEVAKIEDEYWVGEDALAKVAARIREIETAFIADRAGIDETLVLDESTLTFDVQPHPQSNKEVLDVAVERAEDALDDVLALGKGNGLSQNTVEARILLRLFRKYRDDPRRVVFDFAEVSRSITGNMEVGEYPKDSPHNVLLSTLKIGVDEICTVEPDLREELERNFSTPPKGPLPPEDILVLTDAMQVLPELSKALLTRQFGEDIIEVLYGEIVDYVDIPEVGNFALTTKVARLSVRRRFASRIAKMYLEIKRRGDLVAHYDSDTFKKARVVGTYGGIMTLLAALLKAVSMMI